MYINHVWKKKKIKLYIKPRRAYFFKAGRFFYSNLVHLLIISMTKKRRDKKHKKIKFVREPFWIFSAY